MNRYPWIVWLGGGILGYVAGEMILKDDLMRGWLGAVAHHLQHALPVGLGVVLTALGWWFARATRPAARA
jgi:predicted tellurium resistance membrane protein TerC